MEFEYSKHADVVIVDFGSGTRRAEHYVNANTLDRLRAENERLKNTITAHNSDVDEACRWMQENRGCSDYIIRGRRCPECPQDWLIEIDEEMKQ